MTGAPGPTGDAGPGDGRPWPREGSVSVGPRCWAWPTIRAALEACGQASVAMLAGDVYGDASDGSRRAMAMMLCDLARRRIYPGGPWLSRARWGWYALPGTVRSAYPSKALVRRALGRRPRTMPELERLSGVHPSTIRGWLAELAKAGVPLGRGVAPRGRRDRGWCRLYWIGRPTDALAVAGARDEEDA